MLFLQGYNGYSINWVFLFFKFKIGLIRQNISFKKQNFLFSNSQLTDYQPGIKTTTPKSQLLVGHKEKFSIASSQAGLVLVEFT